jgi:V/A-type H+/Na+-transporting ATPase subunit D
MSFGSRVTATKIELIKIRRSMQVAKMVHKILDDKREVLLKKIDEMIEEANKAREDIWTPLGEIYSSVYNAYMSLGTMTLESISDSTPSIMEVDVNIRRIVDVKIPTLQVKTEEGRQQLSYGFVETNQEHALRHMQGSRIRKCNIQPCKGTGAHTKAAQRT